VTGAQADATRAAPVGEAANAPVSSSGRWLLAAAIGLTGIVFLCLFVHWHEVHLFADAGGAGVLFLVLAVPNALLRAYLPSLGLERPQILTLLALWLLTGAVCFANLLMPVLHTAGTLNNPAYKAKNTAKAREYMRPELFLSEEAARAYANGSSEDRRYIPLSEVPWSAWWGPMKFWVPFMLLVVLFSMSLVRIVHRQWSRHELLSYPLADFADAMITPAPQRAFPAIFYDRTFWCGFLVIFFVYLLNGLSNWFPQVVDVPLRFAHYDLVKQFPFLNKYCGSEAYSLFRATLYPAVIAIAVLLPAEISLTAWLGWVLMILGTGVYFLLVGEAVGRSDAGHIRMGSYMALAVMLLYIGRREYGTVIRHACRIRPSEDPGLRAAVRACRVFVLTAAGLVGLLCYAGLDWFLACLAVGTFALVVLLAARMTAEMGFPWLENLGGLVSGIPAGIFGVSALGPKGLALMSVIGTLLAADMTNSVAAQETTIDRLLEKDGPRGGRVGLRLALVLGVCVALGAGFFFMLWENYSFGAQREGPCARGLSDALRKTVTETDRLASQGLLDAAQDGTGIARLKHVRLPDNFLRFFLAGALIVVLCASMRLRFTWWPLHPLPFLFFGTWAMSRMYFSFLLGWLIKMALLRIGGGRVFSMMKPFFLGVIAGQIVIAGIWIVVNAIYYLVTGDIESSMGVRTFV